MSASDWIIVKLSVTASIDFYLLAARHSDRLLVSEQKQNQFKFKRQIDQIIKILVASNNAITRIISNNPNDLNNLQIIEKINFKKIKNTYY